MDFAKITESECLISKKGVYSLHHVYCLHEKPWAKTNVKDQLYIRIANDKFARLLQNHRTTVDGMFWHAIEGINKQDYDATKEFTKSDDR